MFKLKTKRLILCDLRDSDKEAIQKNINNIDISKWLLVVPHPYTLADAEWFINHCKEKAKREEREAYELGIINKENNEFMGVIGLTKVNFYNGTATMGYWLGKDYRQKGYMFEATSEIIRFAFEDLKLRRINMDVFDGNEPSENLIKKLGFEYEGTAKEKDRSKADGKIHDTKEYGLLKKNWKNKN